MLVGIFVPVIIFTLSFFWEGLWLYEFHNSDNWCIIWEILMAPIHTWYVQSHMIIIIFHFRKKIIFGPFWLKITSRFLRVTFSTLKCGQPEKITHTQKEFTCKTLDKKCCTCTEFSQSRGCSFAYTCAELSSRLKLYRLAGSLLKAVVATHSYKFQQT